MKRATGRLLLRGAAAAFLALALACGACSNHAAPPMVSSPPLQLLSFPSIPAGGGAPKDLLPPGWEPYAFEKIPRKTEYEVVVEDTRPALRARAAASASAVRRRVAIAPATSPLVEWSWKVAGPVVGADCSARSGDDCAARVLLLYRYDPARASLVERAKFESLRSLHGEYPPWAMLVYAWTERRASADPFSSPSSDRVKIVPVRRGAERAGEWLVEKRNHVEDFHRAFGEEPGEIEGVALMTDTDDTGSSATAWFGSLRFTGEGREGCERLREP